jgi:hypothetical protein
VGYLKNLASSQGNKKEDIDKRRKKKKDVQVFNIPRATQTPANIENLEHDVNHEFSKFQNSPKCVVHEENSHGVLRNRRGHAT